jgi:hypothetical protein
MKAKRLSTLLGATLLAWAAGSVAQTSYDHSESKRCNTMTGEQKEQCLRDEANKAQGTTPEQSSAGETRAPASLEQRYGRSPHCDTMTGEAKQKCLEAEAQKDQNPQPSKSGD